MIPVRNHRVRVDGDVLTLSLRVFGGFKIWRTTLADGRWRIADGTRTLIDVTETTGRMLAACSAYDDAIEAG